MSYLHVTIKKKDSDKWLCIFKDLSESDLKQRLLKPYKTGKELFYEGNILPVEQISVIRINKTKLSHEDELRIVQDESYRKITEFNNSNVGATIISTGYGYDDYEINECGDDVTSDYLSSGPGTGTLLTHASELIRHPWVVRIFGGIVFLMVAAYLGLK